MTEKNVYHELLINDLKGLPHRDVRNKDQSKSIGYNTIRNMMRKIEEETGFVDERDYLYCVESLTLFQEYSSGTLSQICDVTLNIRKGIYGSPEDVWSKAKKKMKESPGHLPVSYVIY